MATAAAGCGSGSVRVLKEESDLLPYSWDTIKRAAKELGIRGEGEKKARVWMLPGQHLGAVIPVDFGGQDEAPESGNLTRRRPTRNCNGRADQSR